jgi:hypothetical protein
LSADDLIPSSVVSLPRSTIFGKKQKYTIIIEEREERNKG